jgi:hypothetical protein
MRTGLTGNNMKIRNIVAFSKVIIYLAVVVILFIIIKIAEPKLKDYFYTFITKRIVADVSGVPFDKRIIGVYRPELPYSFVTLRKMEEKISARFSIVSFYQAWGEDEQSFFPVKLVKNVSEQKCIPLITWEPWVNKFSDTTLRPMPFREQNCLTDIANGKYDFYIAQWAKDAVTWGKPFFLRFAHEMTNPQYPWTPQNGNNSDDYINAWRHVHSVFDSLGARNVLWVWCPYQAGSVAYYPGSQYVDWIAFDIFNYGELIALGDDSRWNTFDQLVSPLYCELVPLKKPIMIAELGCSDVGGDRAVWYSEMFEQIQKKFHAIKAVVFFDNPADRTSGKLEIDWSITEVEEIINVLKEQLSLHNFTYCETLEKNRYRKRDGK